MRRYIPLIAMSVLLTGCPRPSQYVRPELPVPATWPAGSAAETGAPAPDDLKWQEFFGDQRLRSVIELALANNRDLRMASLNIEKFQALYRIQRAEQFPTVVASASADAYRVPKTASGQEDETVAQFTVGLGMVSWELDFFGRIRSLKSRALEQYLATEQARRSVQISLIAEVAANYLTLAADRERLALSKETLANYLVSYDLSRSRFEVGIASALDFNQAKTAVEAARVEIARYTTLVAQDENALNLVVGAPVPAELLPPGLSETLTAMQDLPSGLPSDVLLRRPDILQAESLLKGYNANIGAARAAFFPRIVLVSTIGTGSSELSGLFGDGSLVWSFVPSVTLPIFDAGRNQANLQVAEVDRDIAVARYEQAIQTAFREVADALARRGTIDEQLAAQQSLTDATAESYRLSQARFDKGVDNYLAVLVSQRFLYGAQQSLISARLDRLDNQVRLYKALGGG